MKRGLIEWDREELAPAALEERQARCRGLLEEHRLDGLLLYTDVWRSGQVRYLTNFVPYWNQGVLLFPRAGEPSLVVGLSARVYPWIKENSTLGTIVSGAPLGAEVSAQVKRLGWKRVGLGERENCSHGLLNQLSAGLADCELVDATSLLNALRNHADRSELALFSRAHKIADESFAESAPVLVGKSGWQAAALLERSIRRRGAADTVILLSPGGSYPPGYPTDEIMTASGFVVLSVEYKGHWAEIGRPFAIESPQGRVLRDAYTRWVQTLRVDGPLKAPADFTLTASAAHRSFPFTPVDSLADLPQGSVIALHLSGVDRSGNRTWWGDTLVIDGDRVRPLSEVSP
jgi:Xaa-Pro aminopeptidase